MNMVLISVEELKKMISDCLQESKNNSDSSKPLLNNSEYISSIKSLATFLHCSEPKAQKLKNSGKIRFAQFGRKFLISPEELVEDLKKNKK